MLSAMHYDKPEDCRAIHVWMGTDVGDGYWCGSGAAIALSHYPEDSREAVLGDWIVRGVDGVYRAFFTDGFERWVRNGQF